MSKQSGLVAILDKDGKPTGEIRDLGPVPVQVKTGRVLPIDEVRPKLKAGEEYGAPSVEIVNGRMKRTWPAIVPDPEPPSLDERVAALETQVAELVNAKLARS